LNSKVGASDEVKSRLLREREQCEEEVKSFLSGRISYKINRWVAVFCVILYGIILFSIFMGLKPAPQEQPIFIPLINVEISRSSFALGLIILAGLTTTLDYWFSRRHLKKFSRVVCFFTSVSAAESLEKGNRVDAGFFVDILFSRFETFAETKRISVSLWDTSLKNLLHEVVETLHENHDAVKQAVINESKLSNEFSGHLYLLADELFSENENSNYNQALESLHYFAEKSKKYWLPTGFLGRHKKVKRTMPILTELLKLTIVPILLFILWLIFGYKG